MNMLTELATLKGTKLARQYPSIAQKEIEMYGHWSASEHQK